VPTYVMLANWTDQGARNVKESPRRLEAAKKSLREMGGEFRSIYMTLGEYDLVLVYDAGHVIDTERPEAFAEVVGDFLERHEAFLISRTDTLIHP